MAEIKVNVTASKQQRVTVSSLQNNAEITASADTGRIWAQTSKNWAVSDVIVDNTDYSSKHYAQEAKTSAQNAESYENSVKSTYNSFIEMSDDAIAEIQGTKEETLTDIETSRLNAVDNINTVKNTAVDSINATKTNILKDIEFIAEGEKEEIQELADNAIEEINSSGINSRANLDLSNLSATGENKFNTILNNKLTNCLLEVPQRIKLELADGVLTLKAGSVVIVPSGSGVFDEVVVESDIVNDLSSTTAQKAFLFYNSSTGKFNGWYAPNIYSGSGAPSSSQTGTLWYDSTNNQFYWKSGSTWVELEGYSLPLGIGTWDGSKWTSIDQVFNGMGYIGSTVWVDKGVKGLIPNGRNEDGTLRNFEFTTSKLIPCTNASYLSMRLWYVINIAVNLTNSTTDYWVYNDNENYYKHEGQNGFFVIVAESDTTNGVISNFQPKQPVKLIDYESLVDISEAGIGFPSNRYIDLTLGASGTTYTAPANGYFTINKITNSANQYTNLVNETNGMNTNTQQSSSSSNTRAFLPTRKGDIVKCSYSAGGTTQWFRFVYAEGEV